MLPILPSNGGVAAVSPTKQAETTSYQGENTADPLRMKLQREYAAVQNKKGALEIQKYINKNRLRELRKKILNEIFSSLQEVGVKLDDPESIREFLEYLSKKDPNLVQMLEFAFTNLTEKPEGQTQEAPAQGENTLASRYANLQQRVQQ